ncbi:polysaccharide deacetylase family protein [Brevundimonas vesicularis]|uniref:polysaccharide deacetylase family protein n=1 Tax=Brevundimonas vesicularis TaxID=41276 RepID=UPI0038D47FF9
MSLPESYLTYPKRAYGMDQSLYAWRQQAERAKVNWPNGQAVAAMVVVPIEHHTLTPSGKPFKHPGAMVTPYPDLRHYTTRDYGNRVGVFRILKALKAAGVKATFPINANQLERLKPLIDAIIADGHEIAAYGLSTDHIHFGALDRGTEEAWVAEVCARFDAAGLKPRAWLSPARQQSFNTLEIIRANGFDICLDWEHDDVPVDMATDAGVVQAVPLSNEIDDRNLLIEKRQSEDSWAAQVLEAVDYLKSEADRFGGRSIGLTLTPYVSGLPFRAHAVRRILDAIGGDAGVWSATASEIADAVR